MVFHVICPPTGESRFTFKIAAEVDGKETPLRDRVKRSIAEYRGV